MFLPLIHLLVVSQGSLNLQQLCLCLSLHLCPSLSLHRLAAETAISLIMPTLRSAAFGASFKVACFKEKAKIKYEKDIGRSLSSMSSTD